LSSRFGGTRVSLDNVEGERDRERGGEKKLFSLLRIKFLIMQHTV